MSQLPIIIAGQFWNIPISVQPPNQDGLYNITVTNPSTLDDEVSQSRSFLGRRLPRTWDNTPQTCFFVGDSQGGPRYEDGEEYDSVIQGDYTEYIVDSLFTTEFEYARFNSQCIA